MEKKYKIGLYEKAMPASLSYREKLTVAGRCGFDFVELSIDESDEKLARLDYSAQERQQLIAAVRETGIPFGSMCLSGHRKYPFGSLDKSTRVKSMVIMQKALVLAAELGIRIIQLAGYDVYYEEGNETTRSFFLENLRRAVEYAAQAGVLLGFETMETPFMDTVEKAMHYVHAIHSPYLGVYPDLGNLTNAEKQYGTPVCADLQTGSGHLLALHLKETIPGVYREVPFGTGHVDFAAGIQKVWDLGVRRFVTELWCTDSEWEAAIRQAHTMMTKLLDRH